MSGDEDRPVIQRSPYPDVEIPELSVTEYTIGPAAARGDATAIIDGITGERTTYAELSKRVAAAARAIARLGVGQGDVVALMSRNQPAYIIAFHGAIAAGGSVTPLNPVLTAREATDQVGDSGAKVVIVDDGTVEKGQEVARAVGAALVVLDRSWPGSTWIQRSNNISEIFYPKCQKMRLLLQTKSRGSNLGEIVEVIEEAASPRRLVVFVESKRWLGGRPIRTPVR